MRVKSLSPAPQEQAPRKGQEKNCQKKKREKRKSKPSQEST
jgi:hypothetical protein